MGQHRIAESHDAINHDVTDHNGRNRPKQLHCSASWDWNIKLFPRGGGQDSARRRDWEEKTPAAE
jgi:hypothetical protein